MKDIQCAECDGKGHLTAVIAGDVHIAECTYCSGWGVLDKPTLVEKLNANKKHSRGKLETINLDDFLTDVDTGSVYVSIGGAALAVLKLTNRE